MSVVVIGLNHRTMPLDLFERMTVDGARLPKALHDLHARDHIGEVVVLSTCNRTEVYAIAERFHGAYADVRNFLAELAFVAPDEFADHLYVHYDAEAIRHLFSVSAGLDSAVIGEAEILGQVRTAWERAGEEGTAGPVLNLLFRHALETGKRARTDTGIARGTASVSHAAVEMAAERLGDLAGAKVLIMGAGEMAEGMATALQGAGVADVQVANRTWRKARALADRIGGAAVRLSDLSTALTEIDLLLTSTGATVPVVEHDDFAPVMAERAGRPLLIVDIAVPRDVDPAVAQLPGVTLLNIDDLRRFAQAGVERRSHELAAVESIIDEELGRFRSAASARGAAPLVASLHRWADEVREAELHRFAGRLEGLDDRQREAVEALAKGLVAKLLHQPTVTLKDTAGSATGERLADATRQLFDLDGPA
ncbi:MAG: glutamyl-tRNA reductase [Acidimicrobiales bacterium]|nr:glutamyl-tRNA reductase [Acidimicrobiales bacterium]HRW38667.1 glutamyl-tRNA reductase [Aquihabitans sp.]